MGACCHNERDIDPPPLPASPPQQGLVPSITVEPATQYFRSARSQDLLAPPSLTAVVRRRASFDSAASGSQRAVESSAGLPIKTLKEPIDVLYSLTRLLHKDNSSLVYLATHLRTGQDRVVKRIDKVKRRKAHIDDGEGRLRSEVRMLSLLDHPNILKIHELYEDKQYFYLVSEALTGGYLMDYLTREKNLSEQLAAKIIMQVMKALAYCHSRGVLHRNLRMDSLILQSTPTDGNVHVILTGFGSTALMSLKEILSTKIGSALFIAPEALRYDPSEKADVWSCGVILHMLLCGNPLFNGPNTDAIIEQIQEEPVTFPRKLWEGVSSEAINLLRGMLTKDPAARLSLRECLEHPWIRTNSVCKSHDSKPIFQALRNLKAFEAKRKVKQTILTFMAAHFDTQEETKALRDAFISVDTNGDGRISLEELVSAYCQIMSRDEAVFVAEKVIKCVDLDHNGFIDYSEFMLATKNHKMLMNSQNLRSIFTQFDRDNSGKISFSEFQETLRGQKLQTDDEMWAELLVEVDSDGDGELNLQEFTKLMLAAVDMSPGKLRR